jgi:TatA/E family protein of Tat protein translocase
MGNLGLSELVVIAVIALLVIGPRRLPEVARGLGEAMRAFQDALKQPSNRDPQD